MAYELFRKKLMGWKEKIFSCAGRFESSSNQPYHPFMFTGSSVFFFPKRALKSLRITAAISSGTALMREAN